VAYHRPRAICQPRRYKAPPESEPMTEAQFEAMLCSFREGPGREDREDAAAIERELVAEARRVIGLSPMRPRRPFSI
jgi:hypothetical protein